MKRLTSIIICLAFVAALNAQVSIVMEQEGGVYKVPCVVNGAKMKFIFDTGAANVCLSLSMAEYLFDNDYITVNDFVGTGKSQVADGRIVDHLKLILRDIEIGGKHIKNVEAIVIAEQRAPLLLGQSAIQKLGDVVISGNRLIIKDKNNTLSKEDAERLCDEAVSLFEEKRYYAAATKFEIVDNAGIELSEWHYKGYAVALSHSEQYDKCIAVCTRWLNNNQNTEDITSKAFYAWRLGDCYQSMSPPRYDDSNKWCRIAFQCMVGNPDYDDIHRITMLKMIGRNLRAQENYDAMWENNFEKIDLLKKAVRAGTITPAEKKEILIDIYYQKLELARYYQDQSSIIKYKRILAYYGEEDYIKFCDEYGYSYSYFSVLEFLIKL